MVVLNMLVGVLVEVVANVMNAENDRMAFGYVKQRMLELSEKADFKENGDGWITREEFDEILIHPAASQIIEDVGVDVVGLVDFSEFIYKDCDALQFDHFVEVVLDLRDSKKACVKDIHYLRKYFTKEFKRYLSEAVEEIEERMLTIVQSMDASQGTKSTDKSTIRKTYLGI